MAIKKISDATKTSIANKTALSLPNNPTNAGYSPEAIKRKLYAPLIDDTNSLSAEINRVIDEANTENEAVLVITDTLEASKLNVDGSNATATIKLRDTTFDTGTDTDAIKHVDLATYAEVGKTNLKAYVDSVQAQVDARITQDKATTDFYLKSDVDAELALKSDNGHTHVEAEITDLDKYSQADADAKFMGKGNYVDSNDKFLFSKFPDVAKQQTYVKATFEELPVVDVLAGSKGFITSTGDSYIYDGLAWVIMSDADWQNVSLEWANIVNPPVANGGISLAGGTLYTKAQADALLLTKSNTGHVHTEAEVTDLDKYTQAEVDAIALLKSNVGHTHTEVEITNLDKYTQAEADALLLTKAPIIHTHVESDITDLDKYTQTEVDSKLGLKSNTGHTHYEADITDLNKYTQGQVDTLLAGKVNLTGDNSQIKADKIDVTDTLDKFVGTNVETVLAELFDTKVPTTKLGGTTEGNIPLLDAEGLIAPQYLGDRYSDVFKGYGVFDLTNPEVPILLEIYASSQWDELENAPIVGAVAYPKRANAIYVTANVTINTMYRYAETTLEFVGLAPSPLGLGNTAGTAYPGNEGQANRNAITNIVAGDTIVDKATKDAIGNTITTTYATKTELTTHENNTTNPHGVTVAQIGAEPAFTKNTAFNKSLGVIAGTVSEGNHLHTDIYEPKNANIQTHISSVTNPHGVTATQVDLGNVQNYGIATELEAQTGTANDKYMTPLRTAQTVANTAPMAHEHTFAVITTKPTTIAGYGITDAYTKTETNTQISTYDNTISELTATTVKGAIDEIDGNVDGLEARTTVLESKIDVIGLDYKEYGVREVVGQSASNFERVTRFGGEIKLGSATGLVANVAIDDAVVANSFDYIPIFKREKVGVDATDLSSNVVSNTFVKVPKFYIKEEWANEGGTDYHYIFMSQFKHEGYRLPLPFRKQDGSERDYTYIGAYEAFLDGNNKLRSLTGQIPKVSYSRNNFRTAARALDGLGVNSKYQITDLAEYVDLVQIPFMIEFATKHSQGVFLGATSMAYSASHTAIADGTGVNAIVVSNATGSAFVLGQTVSIGTSHSNDSVAKDRIVTQIDVDTPNAGETTITFDGTAVNIAIGNVIASRAWKTGMTDSVKVSGTHALNDSKHSIVWRGLENPFGNIWKNVDGVKISNWRGYVTENPKDYNDTASVAGVYAEPYLPLGYLNANANNYAQELGYDANYPYAKFPISVQSSSGLYFRDYYYQSSGDRTVFVGGVWYDSSGAGLFYWSLHGVLGVTDFVLGARLSYRP